MEWVFCVVVVGASLAEDSVKREREMRKRKGMEREREQLTVSIFGAALRK